MFSIAADHFTFPPTVYKSSLFSISLTILVNFCIFHSGHLNGYEVIAQCGYDLLIPWLVMLSIFSCLFTTCMSSLRNVYSSPLPIFQLDSLLLSYMSYLYILGINHLSYIWFTNIFSYSVGCLFTLLIISFVRQKHFSLM